MSNGRPPGNASARQLALAARLAAQVAEHERTGREKLRSELSPYALFSPVDDDAWFWLNAEGVERFPQLGRHLPSLPPTDLQLRFVGLAGYDALAEGFAFYALIKRICATSRPLTPRSTILDFGCGWGRISRFFLKDVEPSQIVGLDCMKLAIETCRSTNPWSSVQRIDPLPPTLVDPASCDVIYSFSVFSHLSEAAHLAWVAEFERLLKPGGLLIATTRPREFIELCRQIRAMDPVPASARGSLDSAFLDTEETLAQYDSGQFCHTPTGGGDELTAEFFGETCIPRGYVVRRWTNYLRFVDYIDDRNQCRQQNVIVMQKPE